MGGHETKNPDYERVVRESFARQSFMMKERGTYLVADIYDAEWIRQGAKTGYPEDFATKQPEGDEIQRQAFRKAAKAGVKIAFGTDASVYPHARREGISNAV